MHSFDLNITVIRVTLIKTLALLIIAIITLTSQNRYLQNIPVTERPKHDFQLYAMSVVVQPIKKLGGVDPPLVRAPPGVKLVPATSKVRDIVRSRQLLGKSPFSISLDVH